MKFLVLSVVFVALAVRSAEGQSCDEGKINACDTTYTNKITSYGIMALEQAIMCNTVQEYLDCILQDACQGRVSPPDALKQKIESQLSQYNFNCNLNFGENGGAAGLANIPYYLTMFLAAFGTLLAL